MLIVLNQHIPSRAMDNRLQRSLMASFCFHVERSTSKVHVYNKATLECRRPKELERGKDGRSLIELRVALKENRTALSRVT